mmetsp:Transcript_10623/g.16104  ORF Transcript_10623/g.16104 Transcript_10623/m.16104 type:complete len:109 (-) Transcript_10623:2434-2760(-)
MSNLKVPLEVLSHQFRRTQKHVSREVSCVLETLSSLRDRDIGGEGDSGDVYSQLSDVRARVERLLEVVEASDVSERAQLDCIEARLEARSLSGDTGDVMLFHTHASIY